MATLNPLFSPLHVFSKVPPTSLRQCGSAWYFQMATRGTIFVGVIRNKCDCTHLYRVNKNPTVKILVVCNPETNKFIITLSGSAHVPRHIAVPYDIFRWRLAVPLQKFVANTHDSDALFFGFCY